jgi:hypothetical protein
MLMTYYVPEHAARRVAAAVKSPKSVALPGVAMVTYSIVLTGPEPPPKIPYVPSEQAAKEFLAAVKSPKSVALPVVAIVMYSMVFIVEPVYPPPNKPYVSLEQAAR